MNNKNKNTASNVCGDKTMIIIIEIIKIWITIMTIIVIIKINRRYYENDKVGNREMEYGMCKWNLKTTKLWKLQQSNNCR